MATHAKSSYFPNPPREGHHGPEVVGRFHVELKLYLDQMVDMTEDEKRAVFLHERDQAVEGLKPYMDDWFDAFLEGREPNPEAVFAST